MRYRKLTADNDYTFGGGELDFHRDEPAAVGQAVETRLLLWLGEWFLNTDDGTPYLLSVLGKKPKSVADNTIQSRILTTEGMVNISDYESTIEPNDRLFSVVASINTVYGPTTVQIQNYVNY